MQNKIFSALILLALGLGLVAGPHPCSLQRVENGEPAASCHGNSQGMAMEGMGNGHAHAAASTQAGRPAHGQAPANCCDILCQHVCQMPATAAAQPMAFAMVPIAHLFVESQDSGLPLFSHAVDHIPLV